MNAKHHQSNPTNQCLACGKGKLFFGADGRSRECERCGHRVTITQKQRSAKELLELATFRSAMRRKEENRFAVAGIRILLAQGIGAIKVGDREEAYHALSRVLQSEASDEELARAWLWLSQVFEEQADKRLCLEQVLALNPVHGAARRGLAVLDGRLDPNAIINPDQLNQTSDAPPVEAKKEQFTCPRCAGRMNYTPDGRALLCEFCHHRQALDEADQPQTEAQFGEGKFEQEFTVAMATAKGHLKPVQMRVFQCNSCAVEFMLTPETISVTCPYCDSVYVTETAETQDIMPPHALIPFAITLDDTKLALRRWFKKHKIERPRLLPIVGIYLPVWTFDIGGELRWHGLVKRGDDWTPTSGSHLVFYDDLFVPANKKLPPSLTKGFSEFDFAAVVAYDPRFLADWPAERYQVSMSDASLLGRKKVVKELRRKSTRYTRGEYVRNLRLNSSGIVVESYKHILLPMWVTHYKIEGEIYDVAINGQNGQIHGDRPQSGLGKLFSRLLG
ncbi:MAG: hypothetical protein GY796_06045 [Chloroflexi bacterium]|nr:hypothetical protein [Chloroflexota bacterium]